MGRYGGSNCGKCGGNHRGVCPAYYDEKEHLEDQERQRREQQSTCKHERRYELKATGYLMCVLCGKQFTDKEEE